jgi:hypothetical protein
VSGLRDLDFSVAGFSSLNLDELGLMEVKGFSISTGTILLMP